MKVNKERKPLYLYLRICSLLIILCATNVMAQSTDYDLNKKPIAERQLSGDSMVNPNNFAFPDGKLKCLVMSFDDEPEHDRILIEKLNKANITGTFHFNSGRLGKKADWLSSELGYDVYFVTEPELGTLYQNHEISGHTVHHKGLNNQNA